MKIDRVYLDRDGTINIDRHYLSSPDGFAFCPNALEGLCKMHEDGLELIVITNQSGLARGYFSPDDLTAIHDKMRAELAAHGVTLLDIFHCPHGPDDACDCRKPLPGLIHQAEKRYGVRPAVMIGDAGRDVAAGLAAGHATIRIASTEPTDGPEATKTLPDLLACATWISEQNRDHA